MSQVDRQTAFGPIDPRVRIGHVHLKVSDLARSLDFYCGILGFELMATYGSEAAFIGAGGYHHHIGLNTWESAGGSPPPPGTTGLFHLAVLYPDRAGLGDAVALVKEGVGPSVPVLVALGGEAGVQQGLVNFLERGDGFGSWRAVSLGCGHVLSLE